MARRESDPLERVGQINPKSLTAIGKLTSLADLAKREHLDFLAVTETHLTMGHIVQGNPEEELPPGWKMDARLASPPRARGAGPTTQEQRYLHSRRE